MNFNHNSINKTPMVNNKFKNAMDYMAKKMPGGNTWENNSQYNLPFKGQGNTGENNSQYNLPFKGQGNTNLDPVSSLTPDEISYLQSYLEKIKLDKISKLKQTNDRSAQYFSNGNPIDDHPMERNTHGIANGTNQMPLNRATDIYDPLQRQVPVDWRTFNFPNTVNNQFVSQQIEPGSRGAAYTRPGKRSQQNINLDQVNDYHNPYEYGAKQNILPPIYNQPYNGPYANDPSVLNQMGVSDANKNAQPHIRNINIESSLLQRETTHLPGQRELTEKEVNRFELLPFDPQDHRHIVWTDNMPRGGYPTRIDRMEL